MEKCIQDFCNINDGGDIPEHRIQYFRNVATTSSSSLKDSDISNGILWDRAARMDRLFGSGEGMLSPPSPQTVHNIRIAIHTMARLAEEREMRFQDKMRQRANKAARAKRAAAAAAASLAATTSSSSSSQTNIGTNHAERKNVSIHFPTRHAWHTAKDTFAFNEAGGPSPPNQSIDPNRLKMVTWNVLFDLHRNDSNAIVEGDDSLLGDGDTTQKRWQQLMNELQRTDADIIALQEVTPRFLKQLNQQDWVKKAYVLSDIPGSQQAIGLYGNVTLWKQNIFEASSLYVCAEGDRMRGLVTVLSHGNRILNVANVHLPADKFDKATGTTQTRSFARQREFNAFVAKLQVLQQNQIAKEQRESNNTISIILGDFNDGDSNMPYIPENHFLDAWPATSQEQRSDNIDGFTFDWKLNARADKTRQHGHSD